MSDLMDSFDAETPINIILAIGMSGAGKTSTLKVLEDLDFDIVDNVPLSILNIDLYDL